MPVKSALVFAVILSGLAFAAQPEVGKFLNSSFEPDQNVSVQLLLGGNYALVSADGVETYVLDSSTGKPLQDAGQLQGMLVSDAKVRSGFDALLASANSFSAEVSAAKKGAEAKCMQYVGVDMHDCNDTEACKVTCFAVPQCEVIVHSDGFLEAMVDWNAGRKSFDSLLSSYSQGIPSLGSNASLVDRQLSILSGLSALSANLSANQIFLNRSDYGCANGTARCYEYCPKVDYSRERIASEAQRLQLLKSALASISAQGARANAILSAGMKNDAYLSTRNGRLQELKNSALNSIRVLSEKKAQLSAKVTDPQLDAGAASLASLYSQIDSLGNAGFYRRALALQPQLEQAASGLSARIDSDQNAYSALSLQLSALSETAGKGAAIIGNQSASSYLSQLSPIRARLASPLTLQELASAQAQADQIKANLTSDIAARATGAASAAGQAMKLPCLPAFAMMALLGFAAARKQ